MSSATAPNSAADFAEAIQNLGKINLIQDVLVGICLR